MSAGRTETAGDLFLDDETAWLELMSDAVRRRDVESIDWQHLSEYLGDMARRDRREMKSRLVVLLAHLLKWTAQPNQRTRGWAATILEQSQQLADFAGSGVLRAHAEAVLSSAFDSAVKLAAKETGLSADAFPAECPYTFDGLLAVDPTV